MGTEEAQGRNDSVVGRRNLNDLELNTRRCAGIRNRIGVEALDRIAKAQVEDTLLEAKVLIERWRKEYNTIRPHSALGYIPPAPEARLAWLQQENPSRWLPGKCAAALT